MVGSPIDGQQVSPHGTDMPPDFGGPPLALAIQIIRMSFDIDHMRSQCLHVTRPAMLRLLEIPVTHQRDAVLFDSDDTMQHIATSVNPGHYDIADFGLVRFL